MYFAKAPTRIDLAGGTIDLWPLYLFLEGGITINLAIDLHATAQIDPLEGSRIEIISKDQNRQIAVEGFGGLEGNRELPLLARLVRFFAPASGLRLMTEARVPAGSGLGGSSTLAIAVCGALNAFTRRGLSQEELIGVARDIEAQVLLIPTGEQDYYAAMYGGFHAWHFEVNQVRGESYSHIRLDELRERLLLFYSGLPRSSGINNWQVFKQYIDGDPTARSCLSRINAAAKELHRSILNSDWDGAGAAIAAEWEARKQLAPSITTPEVEEILQFGFRNGCRAGKVCGAGGGGCLFLLMDPDVKPAVERAARDRGWRVLDFQPSPQGLTVTEH